MFFDYEEERRKATAKEVREFMCKLLKEGYMAFIGLIPIKVAMEPEEITGISYSGNRITVDSRRYSISFDLTMQNGHIFNPINNVVVAIHG